MSHQVPLSIPRVLVLAVVLGGGVVLIGCEHQQLGQQIANRLPDVGRDTVEVTESGTMASQDVGAWKRYCSICLLNSSLEESGEAKDGEDGKKSRSAVLSRLPPAVAKFKTLHDEIPPAVVKAMAQHNLRNYSVHVGVGSGDYYAVRYFEYAGSDVDVDLTLLAREPSYREWEEACEACQVGLLPVSAKPLGPFMEEIFHNDLYSVGPSKR